MDYQSFVTKIFTSVWAITSDGLEKIISQYKDALEMRKLESRDSFFDRYKKERDELAISGSNAIIPIKGAIIPHSDSFLDYLDYNYASIDRVRMQLRAALENKHVKQIVLDVDSPGGSVLGLSDLSEEIYNARQIKPILTHTNGMMASAAYFLGSAATTITASKDAMIGSIGTILQILDYSEFLSKVGIKVHVISSTPRKGDGNPMQELSKEARAEFQRIVNKYNDLFVDAVARNLDKPKSEASKLADGRVFVGSDAKDLGLIHSVEVGPNTNVSSNKEPKASASEPNQTSKPKLRLIVSSRPKKVGGIHLLGKGVTEMSTKNDGVRNSWEEVTIEDLRQNRPDLVNSIEESGVRKSQEQAKSVKQAIADTGLPEALQLELQSKCDGKTLAEANEIIHKVEGTEAALASAEMALQAKNMKQEEITQIISELRSDTQDMRVAAATGHIQRNIKTIIGRQESVVTTADGALTGKDTEKNENEDPKDTAIKNEIAAARKEYADQHEGQHGSDSYEAEYVKTTLEIKGIKLKDSELEALCPDLFKKEK